MGYRINPAWAIRKEKDIADKVRIDETIKANLVAKWLIHALSSSNTLFKVYNLGAGVKRITTDTDICPCCKKNL